MLINQFDNLFFFVIHSKMKTKIILTKSPRKGKKMRATFKYPESFQRKDSNKEDEVIDFGSEGSSVYWQHKDKDKRTEYIKRHIKRENWKDLNNAGSLSYHINWNKKTLKDSIEDTEDKFNVDIKNNYT